MLKVLLRKIFPSLGATEKYRPERHYMRGPGPKTRERTNRAGELNKGKA